MWDSAGRRRVEIAKTGSEATIVWNPGPARARALSDLDDDEWPGFLCVESGNVGPHAVHVAPGAHHRLGVNIRSEPWNGA